MNEDDSAAGIPSDSSAPPERVIDFSHYSMAQLQDFLSSIDQASRPATYRALLEEIARRAAGPPQPEVAGATAVRFSRRNGFLGWLEAKSNGLAMYGYGAVQVAADEIVLRGWERTWLLMPVETERRLSISEIRGLAAFGNQLRIECTRSGLKSRRFQIYTEETAQARMLAAQICGSPPKRFDRKWAALSEFNLRIEAASPRIWATYVLVALNVAIYIAMVVAAGGALGFAPDFLLAWGADVGAQTLGGQPWRLLTATFLHISLLHVLLNMWVLWSAGRVIERLYGSRAYLLLYLYSGVLGSVASVYWNPLAVAVGASGAIFGVLGAFIALMVRRRGAIPPTVIRGHLLSTTLFVLFNLLAGLRSPMVDNAAHVGGLVSGFVLGWWLARSPTESEWRLSRRQAATATLVAVVWLSAGLWMSGMFDHEQSAPDRFLKAHPWYMPGEEHSLAAATRIATQMQAGTLSEQAAAKQLQQEVVKFWREANERLSKEKLPADAEQRPVHALFVQYAAVRQRWAEALVQGVRDGDGDALKLANEDVEEATRLVARLQRLTMRSQLDHRHRPLSNSPYVRKLAGLLNRATWKCVGPAAASFARDGANEPARDGPTGSAQAGCEAQRAFVAADYGGLDAMLTRYSSKTGDLLDGSSSLGGISRGLGDLFSAQANWSQALSKLSDWRRERPGSLGAELVEVILFREGAWAARGEGYAADVGQAQWAAFRSQEEMAAAGLSEIETRAQSSPLWYSLSLSVGKDRNASKAELQELFDRGSHLFPDYLPLYSSMVRSLMPRWGGSYEEIDALVSKVHAATLKNHKFEMYARLYDELTDLEGGDFELFQESSAEWAIMQHGFEDLTVSNPQSRWLLNRFAYFACMAKDPERYRALRAQIGPGVWKDAWKGKHSVHSCDERLLARDAAAPKP